MSDRRSSSRGRGGGAGSNKRGGARGGGGQQHRGGGRGGRGGAGRSSSDDAANHKRGRDQYKKGQHQGADDGGDDGEQEDDDYTNGTKSKKSKSASTLSSSSSQYSLQRVLAANTDDMNDDDDDDGGVPHRSSSSSAASSSVSAYDQLLSSLQTPSSSSSSRRGASSSQPSLSSRHSDLLKKTKLEQEGKEEGEEDDEEPEYEDVEVEEGEDEEGEDDEQDDDDDDEDDDSSSKHKKISRGSKTNDEGEDNDDDEDEDGEDDDDMEDGEDDDDDDDDDNVSGVVDGDDIVSDDDSPSSSSSLVPSSDLHSSDVYVRKYSASHVFTPQQLSSLSQEPQLRSRTHPFAKANVEIHGAKEMIFTAGDKSTATEQLKDEEVETKKGKKNKSSTSSSSAPSSSSSSLPALVCSPPSSVSHPLLHIRPKLVDTWNRFVREPERLKLRKQLAKQRSSGKKSEAAVDAMDEDARDIRDDGDEAETLIAKDAPLTPASASCASGCICFLCSDFYSPLQSSLLATITAYRDLIHTNAHPHSTKSNHAILALHVANHLTKSREVVLRNNARVSAREEKEREAKERSREEKKKRREALQKGGAAAAAAKLADSIAAAALASSPAASGVSGAAPGAESAPEHRDQGFTRPKILALFPTATIAHDFVLKLLALLPAKTKSVQVKRKRFDLEFAPTPEDQCHPRKPFDYKLLFDGKDQDAFRVGISLGQRSVKFYTSFYGADLIVASPLGMRMITGSVGDKITERDYDFLSSVEMLIIDQFDVCARMQNIAHLLAVMGVMNTIPYDTKHTDFARIREWNLNGHAAYNRQMIVLAQHPSIELQNFQKLFCANSEGKVQTRTAYNGILNRVIPQVKQIFQRIMCEKLTDLADARFDYFITTVLPQLKTSYPDGRVLVYIPSYFDFVRLRNHAKAKHLSVCHASEYTKNSTLSRGRSGFYHGEVKFMLLTERFHFFKRYAIRGIQHVVFYALPSYEQFYVDFVNLLASTAGSATSSTSATVLALYTKFDAMELERIIGTQRATKLIAATNHTHMFC